MRPRKPNSPKELRDCYRSCFAKLDGKIVLDDLLSQYYRKSSFVPGDPCQTAFNEGRREVVIRILTKLRDAGPDVQAIIDEEE